MLAGSVNAAEIPVFDERRAPAKLGLAAMKLRRGFNRANAAKLAPIAQF
jgi:hypothetical protein